MRSRPAACNAIGAAILAHAHLRPGRATRIRYLRVSSRENIPPGSRLHELTTKLQGQGAAAAQEPSITSSPRAPGAAEVYPESAELQAAILLRFTRCYHDTCTAVVVWRDLHGGQCGAGSSESWAEAAQLSRESIPDTSTAWGVPHGGTQRVSQAGLHPAKRAHCQGPGPGSKSLAAGRLAHADTAASELRSLTLHSLAPGTLSYRLSYAVETHERWFRCLTPQ
jgi:hypothetical protein